MKLTAPDIFRFWLPLQLTWLMMAVEGPFLAAIIARLPEPKFNLAAYGVAFAFAIIIESPVIMMMSASTALVDDAQSFRKLRNFAWLLNVLITAFMLVLLLTPMFAAIAIGAIGLDPEVARLTHGSLLLLIPWPAAIGYRRFFQGLMIRGGVTRRVAYGTVVRLVGMGLSALALRATTDLPGAWIGAASLSLGVCGEAVATRLMVKDVIAGILSKDAPVDLPLTYRKIVHFYYPLALTSTISLAAHPIVTFFMGQARLSLESLAVLPVINSLSFIFRSVGLSYQEVVIALMGPDGENARAIGRFAAALALLASAGLALIAFTPLSRVWFIDVSGLSPELAAIAVTPIRVLAVLPALSVLLAAQRGLLVHGRDTGPITGATLVEVGGIVLILLLSIHVLDLVGATAAAIAFVIGRIGANAYLTPPCRRLLRSSTN